MKNTFHRANRADWGAHYLDCPRCLLVTGARRKNKRMMRRKARHRLNAGWAD